LSHGGLTVPAHTRARTGSGWFAPLVEPEHPMTKEERAAAEKERIEKLKEGRASNSSRRVRRLSPSLSLSPAFVTGRD